MHATRPTTRRGPALAAITLLVGIMGPGLGVGVGVAQTPLAQALYSASTTGTVVHAEALEQPDLGTPGSTRVVDSEIAFSSALVDTGSLTADRHNEWGGLIMPAQPTGINAYGRGYGLDAALADSGGTDDPTLRLAGLAQAAAPPETGPVTEELGPIDGDPVAYASTLKGTAYAQPADVCTLGSDISWGQGYVEGAALLDTASDSSTEGLDAPVLSTSAADPTRNVSWSDSRTFLSAQVDDAGARIGNAVGVVAETRQTIAPVTFLAGTPGEFTIELAGEWRLQARAGGIPGSAGITYGPGTVSPETPLLSIIQGGTITRVLNSQDLFGDTGLVVPIANGDTVLANIVIGEDPRAIGGDPDSAPAIAADGTSASAALDVVRVQLLSAAGVGEAAEVRIGHMEVATTVPAGGLDCGLPVDKSVDEPLVQPGDDFTYTIRVTNPYDCELRNVKVTDTISADAGVTYEVTGTNPTADSVSNTEVVWNDIGPIEPGGFKDVTIAVQVDPTSAGGVFHDTATATAECFGQPVEGQDDEEVVGVPLRGQVTIDLPRVGQDPGTPRLPRTGGGSLAALSGLVLLAGASQFARYRAR